MNDKFCVLEIIMNSKKKCAVLFYESESIVMPEQFVPYERTKK